MARDYGSNLGILGTIQCMASFKLLELNSIQFRGSVNIRNDGQLFTVSRVLLVADIFSQAQFGQPSDFVLRFF
jgi:hypothetical protein